MIHAVSHTVHTAKKVIELSHHIADQQEDQKLMLARAYYTMATESSLSPNFAKLQINSAISVLRNMSDRSQDWFRELGLCYFKRGELLEEEQQTENALSDYLKIITLFQNTELSEDDEYMLVAQSSIAVADLLMQGELPEKTFTQSCDPIYYLKFAIKYLNLIRNKNEEAWNTIAYTYQALGIALSGTDYELSQDAFLQAITAATQTESQSACQSLSDIYFCMALLNQEYVTATAFQTPNQNPWDTKLYFVLSSLFAQDYFEEEQEPDLDLREFFLDLKENCEFITIEGLKILTDALIYFFDCAIRGELNSLTFQESFQQPSVIELFQQKLTRLLLMVHCLENPLRRILNYNPYSPLEEHCPVDISDHLPPPSNVTYLNSNVKER